MIQGQFQHFILALVLLSPLQEDGMPQSARFWPNEGAELHGGIEVNLVTEHVWCREFLVRSLYLRQIETGETRTVTLLHYLGWPLNSTPPSAKRLLEFRFETQNLSRNSFSQMIHLDVRHAVLVLQCSSVLMAQVDPERIV